MRQHLTAVQAAARVCKAETEGARPGSQELVFKPLRIRGGAYRFEVGTAGSTTLIFQTLLPALLLAAEPSTLVLEGGTHNPHAPPLDFLEEVFLPLLRRMGADVEIRGERRGFYPAGGGRWEVFIRPGPAWRPLELLERGDGFQLAGRILWSRVPDGVAMREAAVFARELGLSADRVRLERDETSPGPGNVAMVIVGSTAVTEVDTAFGEKGKAAEAVALEACREAKAYMDAGVPVGRHLADQLLLPMALAAGGRFRTMEPSLHAKANMETIQLFLPVRFEWGRENGAFLISLAPV